jgi:hypothetical protein
VGFPVARLVALFSLASGAVFDVTVGRCRGKWTGEPSLMRQLLGRLQTNSVSLADRFFRTYWFLGLLVNRDVEGVFRLHQIRHRSTYRSGRPAGDLPLCGSCPQIFASIWMCQTWARCLCGRQPQSTVLLIRSTTKCRTEIAQKKNPDWVLVLHVSDR